MKPRMIERELLDKAIQAFQRETGLCLDVIQEQVLIAGKRVDAVIETPHHGGRLVVEVKKWAQQANLGALVNQVKQLPLTGMLVADYVNPNMAKKLKAMDVQFIDTAGNAYINLPPLYIQVAGNKPLENQAGKNAGANRAFDTTGLKVIFGFVCDALLVNAPYRTIAREVGVALGTVGQIVNGLKDTGYIVDRGKTKERRLVNRRKLLDRWVDAYPEKLKPKLRVGEYVNDDPYWWKEFQIEKYGAYWGGEVAAAQYTDYLKPQVVTLYLPEQAEKKLMAAAKLRKALEWTAGGPGIVRIYRPFWQQKITALAKNKTEYVEKNNNAVVPPGLVHPILVYADLIATGDSRNLETARMIYERFIAEYIGEN
ncbi:MAG: type IV toxin-antitoxin system AbiEi family antitoxin [Pseudomonadales bacterium]